MRRWFSSFTGSSWVQVKDAAGAAVVSQTAPAGATIPVGGALPLEVVVGNAERVNATLRGQPLDLVPYTRSTSRVFTVGERDGTYRITRRRTRQVSVDGVAIGGDAPIVVQSMTNTDTADIAATVAQVQALAEAARRSSASPSTPPKLQPPSRRFAPALDAAGCDVPIVGDFHFNGHKLLTESPIAPRRSRSTGSIPQRRKGSKRDAQFAVMIEHAIRHAKPVRIGVNWGSLDAALLAR